MGLRGGMALCMLVPEAEVRRFSVNVVSLASGVTRVAYPESRLFEFRRGRELSVSSVGDWVYGCPLPRDCRLLVGILVTYPISGTNRSRWNRESVNEIVPTLTGFLSR